MGRQTRKFHGKRKNNAAGWTASVDTGTGTGGGGTGAGLDPFVTNKQVVFLGDSTFFHSGLIAISDSLKNGQDITYVILDNKTTAMTGHQPTPGTDQNLMGETTFARPMEPEITSDSIGWYTQ